MEASKSNLQVDQQARVTQLEQMFKFKVIKQEEQIFQFEDPEAGETHQCCR